MENQVNQLEDLNAGLKSLLESKESESAEAKAKINEIETKIAAIEEAAFKEEKLNLAKAEIEEKLEELGSQVKTMEKAVYRSTTKGTDKMNTETKEFESFLRTNDHKYLRTDRDPDGGYLVPQELHNQIINKIIEVSDMRRLARVVQISGKALDVDRRDSDLTVGFLGEGATVTDSAPQYGKIIIPANKLMAEVRITHELLGDSAFDMVSELNMRAAEKFAQVEGEAFINGTSPSEPQGLLNASGLINVNSGSASALTADAFFSMLGEMKYRNPTFIMNRKTFAAARKLKSGGGDYLLQGGMDGRFDGRLGGVAGMIAGVPIMLMQDMPDIGGGNTPVALIDGQEAYMIVDRVGLRVLRDDYTLASEDKVKFVMSRRVGGAVVNPEAIVTMTIAS
jgi:HK97 family phage major capsid protein